MPTSFRFNSTQLTEIKRLRDLLILPENRQTAGGGETLYAYIFKSVTGIDLTADILSRSYAAIGNTISNLQLPVEVVRSLTWLFGALQVNINAGAFSSVIRQYNVRQGELRGLGSFGDTQLNTASNAVAALFAGSIIDPLDDTGATNTTFEFLPQVQEIGNADLKGVRDTLYPGNTTPGSELYLNQAWPGIVMLGVLGGQYTDRFLRYDDNAPGTLNSLADFKSILFAWDAFESAYNKTGFSSLTLGDILVTLNWPADAVANTVNEYLTNGAASFPQLIFSSLASTQNSDAKLGIDLVAKTGSHRFLDMITGARQGKNLIGTTNTAAEFQSTAMNFFGQFSSAQLQAIDMKVMPSAADQLASLATADVNTRAALAALSSVSVEVSDEVAQKFSLYDAQTDQGEITHRWIDEHAKANAVFALYWKRFESDGVLSLTQVGLPFWQWGDTDVVVAGSAGAPEQKVTVDGFDFGVAATRLQYFGGDADNIRTGSESSDHMYGGGGNDFLESAAGNDYLEGNRGDDQLAGGSGTDSVYGGDGNDLISGGSDDDTLFGGRGDDTIEASDLIGADNLQGGAGFDTYMVDNSDKILDSDRNGVVYLNQNKLGFAIRKKGESVYKDSNGNAFVFSGELLSVNGGLHIEKFKNGDLGIYLDEQDTPPDPNDPTSPDYDPNRSRRRIDPLALDLNHNGRIDTIGSAQSVAYFDFNNDGIAERSGWIAADDGLLALDVNHNGVIDNLSELFGTATLSGFEDLKQRVDSNADQQIDASDANFGALQVWQDNNGDGIAQMSELNSLAQAGITSISLTASEANLADADNLIVATSSMQQSGQTQLIADVELAVNFAITDGNPNRALDQSPNLDPDVFTLPWLRGYGIVKSLHIAYQENPPLKQAAQALAALEASAIINNFGTFFANWSGLSAAHAANGVTRTTLTVEDKVWMLESLMGQNRDKIKIEAAKFAPLFFFGSAETAPGWDAGYVNSRYAAFESRAALGFAMQAKTRDWLNGAHFSLALDRFVLTDGNALQASLQGNLVSISNADEARFAGLMLARLRADGIALAVPEMKLALASSPFAGIFNTALDFTGKHVVVLEDNSAFSATDNHGWMVLGSGANDNIQGGIGNDILQGNQGNDALNGGAGDDTYIFQRGDGADVLSDRLGQRDILRFASGIHAQDVILRRDAHNLYFSFNNSSDKINVLSWFDGSANKIERIEFADGSVWGEAEVHALLLQATVDADYLAGNDAEELIAALAGNDIVIGNAGNDTLDGGNGNDTLDGGSGNDLYLYQRGDGSDTISEKVSPADSAGSAADTLRFDANISPADVVVRRDASHLYLVLQGSSDRITLQNWFVSDLEKIERVEFHNGVSWDMASLHALAATATTAADYIEGDSGDNLILGLAGNDYLQSNVGNDTLIGGTGDDQLLGGGGSDVYLYQRGDGSDSINDYDPASPAIDSLRFDASVTAADLTLSRDFNHLYINIAGGSDRITVKNWFVSDCSFLERIEFSDGTFWNMADIASKLLTGSSANDDLIGTSSDELLRGFAGNDVLRGNPGNDTLVGGLGNDALNGGVGNDLYLFQRGDGIDSISDNDPTVGNLDTLRFGADITQNDIKVRRNGSTLELSIKATNDLVRIQNWFLPQDEWKLEVVEFADGSSWTMAEVVARSLIGDDDNDYLSGTAGDDLLRSLGGHDTIYAGEGNDTLVGGTGDDTLQGAIGSDVYLYQRGDGNDTIAENDAIVSNIDTLRFAAGITPADVQLSRDVQNLYLTLADSGEKITIKYWFTSPYATIERIEFNDGTLWNAVDVTTQLSTASNAEDYLIGSSGADLIASLDGNDSVFGLDGNDSLNGGVGQDNLQGGAGDDLLQGSSGDDVLQGDTGDDVLEGGSGKDNLRGGTGNDVYVFQRNDGQDIISDVDTDAGNIDSVRFAAGIHSADVLVQRAENALILSIKDSSDSISISDWFNEGFTHKIELVQFQDGTQWNIDDLHQLALRGSDGDDNLLGNKGNDLISGFAGNDQLQGEQGNDTLDGGSGNDTMHGGTGNDIYLFKRGDGMDIISEHDIAAGNLDTLRFATGIAPADLILSSNDNDLIITIAGSSERITMTNWINNPACRIEKIEFADAASWDVQAIIAQLSTGGEGDDDLAGTNGDELLRGFAGNDRLEGRSGDDTLVGGLGNDRLLGGSGNDTYLFQRGDGQDNIEEWDITSGNVDTLRFAVGIAASDVLVSRDQDHLYLTLQGSSDKITLNNWFRDLISPIEQVAFDDGTVWNSQQLLAQLPPVGASNDSVYGSIASELLHGLGGNDTIFAGAGDDTLAGGSGNDQLFGGSGNDSYLFQRGDGQDQIDDNDALIGNQDTLHVGAGIASTDVLVTRDQEHLYLALKNSSDKVTLRNWFQSDVSKIERIQFDDGSAWSVADILAKLSAAGAGDDNLYGVGSNALLSGLGGNDTLHGGNGNDTLDGGSGNDILLGGNGDDVYLFARGDGNDTIIETYTPTPNVDIVRFAAGILPTDVSVSRYQNTLYLSLVGGNDRITLDISENNRIERVEFANGTTWSMVDLLVALDSGSSGDDFLVGTEGNDRLLGLAGNDILVGNAGNDTLEGGIGNDEVYGGIGNDLYIYNRGDGADILFDYEEGTGNTDTLRFGAGILAADVLVTRSRNDLFLNIQGTSDRLTLSNWANNDEEKIERVQFADGSVWSVAELLARLPVASNGADLLGGTASDDVLLGLAGDDLLLGLGGDDTLDGGRGNDSLEGGLGNDTYLYTRGDGSDIINDYDVSAGNLDTLKLLDMNSVDVYLTRDTYHLYLHTTGTSDKLDLGYWFEGTEARIERIQFADGSSWNEADMLALSSVARVTGTSADDRLQASNGSVFYLSGLAGNDTMSGGENADTFEGGTGNDVLVGNAGNDVYLFNRGDGLDYIDDRDWNAPSNIDTLRFGSNITMTDVTLTRNQTSLFLSLKNSTDRVTLENWFSGDQFQVERVEFANGATWHKSDLLAQLSSPSAGDDYLIGTNNADVLNGLAGNDTLIGGNGSDSITGGAGNDQLEGGDAIDVYLYARGFGTDEIYDSDGLTDIVRFGTGIDASEVQVTRGETALYLSLGESTERISLSYWLRNDGDTYEVQFADGTHWDEAQVLAQLRVATATIGNDEIYGLAADELINGLAGNDIVVGGAGNDTLIGGNGNDRYIFNLGDGQERIDNSAVSATDNASAIDTLFLGEGIDSATMKLNRIDNDLMITINLDDSISIKNYFLAGSDNKIDQIEFASGAQWDKLTFEQKVTALPLGNASANTLIGTGGNDILRGLNGNDTLYGGTGDDQLFGDAGSDTLYGNKGNDTLDGGASADKMYGGAGNDNYIIDSTTDVVSENAAEGMDQVQASVSYTLSANVEVLMLSGTGNINGSDSNNDNLLQGNAGINTLTGTTGRDILQGAAGNDTLSDNAGNNVLDGGAGNDKLIGGAGNELLSGGVGADTITTGVGADVIVFNRGDGIDLLNPSTGKDNTLSLGRGIKYADLVFKKSTNDLILVTAVNEQITFKDWYLNINNHSIANLQVVIEGTSDYNANASSALNNRKVTQFDFDGLVSAFDQARVATPSLSSWALSSSLLNYFLNGSDSAAIGGDLAYQYAKNGNMTAISLTPAQALLAHPQFGSTAQGLQANSALRNNSAQLL